MRVDNMGDVLLSSPAIRGLKETFSCKITLLTSTKAQGLTNLLPEIDEFLVVDLPWVQNKECHDPDSYIDLINKIKLKAFDGCVIFTVYSQNPMPAILLAYLAGIPLRLAYCRENPYHLLSHWIPDPEPYQVIKHQVTRDLDLIVAIGAHTKDEQLTLSLQPGLFSRVQEKLKQAGVVVSPYNFYVLHPGVTEVKRRYPKDLWIALADTLVTQQFLPVLISGNKEEAEIAAEIAHKGGCKAIAGLLALDEFAALLENAKAVISVNTGAVHLAAAVQTPVVVLYAQTNPQHVPWLVSNRVLPYSVPD
ncbi:glycosyltransferase family 9 protein, partial [Pedobacter sp.]|uniref:glycosyltransferase family 9 protein n=1 Tax=Pedobacter sp. TaxID=1411316 RepID=UPI003D7F9965